MTDKTRKIAIEALKKWAQRTAVDANLYERGIAGYPAAEHAFKLRERIRAAIIELEGSNTDLPLFAEAAG